MMIRILPLFFLFAFLSGKSQQFVPVTDFATIKQMVMSNRFVSHYTIATTHHTYYLQPTTPYSDQNIRIASDSAFIVVSDSIASGYLPYFGYGYSIPQIGVKGIIFSQKMVNKNIQLKGKGRKQSIFYEFSIEGLNDTYQIRMDIRNNGMCNLFINSIKRSPISYAGQIVKKVD